MISEYEINRNEERLMTKQFPKAEQNKFLAGSP